METQYRERKRFGIQGLLTEIIIFQIFRIRAAVLDEINILPSITFSQEILNSQLAIVLSDFVVFSQKAIFSSKVVL